MGLFSKKPKPEPINLPVMIEEVERAVVLWAEEENRNIDIPYARLKEIKGAFGRPDLSPALISAVSALCTTVINCPAGPNFNAFVDTLDIIARNPAAFQSTPHIELVNGFFGSTEHCYDLEHNMASCKERARRVMAMAQEGEISHVECLNRVKEFKTVSEKAAEAKATFERQKAVYQAALENLVG